MCANQVQNTTTAIHALWGTSVPWDQPSLSLALLASLVTSLMPGQEVSVTLVQPVHLTTCRLRRHAYPVAAPPPRQQVRTYSINNIQRSKSVYILQLETPLRSHLSSQALHLVPVSVKIERSSTRMAHVCAKLVLFSTMNWISKALLQTVYMTASLRSVIVLLNVTCLHFFLI